MYKPFIITALLFGALAVLLGAFGAHGLKAYANEQILSTYETAVKYQFFHVFALALAGVLYKEYPIKGILIAGRLFIIGTFFFSGSLYLLTLLSINGNTQFKWIGAITPIGGLLLISGWVLLAVKIAGYKR
jgi:uncharacterized membrane protein YgdD (TMEM256/DUF423 family)